MTQKQDEYQKACRCYCEIYRTVQKHHVCLFDAAKYLRQVMSNEVGANEPITLEALPKLDQLRRDLTALSESYGVLDAKWNALPDVERDGFMSPTTLRLQHTYQ
jgi:hypothetical protein